VKLYIDLESRELIEAPGFRNPVTTLRFKRGDSAKLEVAFLTDRTTYTSLGDAEAITMRFGVKQSNRFDLDFLAYCADWIMPGEEDVSPVYVCYPSFNTAGLDAALDVGENPEIASLTLMGEITWSVGDGEPTSTRTFVVIVENDVIRGNESGPSGITAGIPTNATLEIAGTLSPDVTGFVDCYIDTHGNWKVEHLRRHCRRCRSCRLLQHRDCSGCSDSESGNMDQCWWIDRNVRGDDKVRSNVRSCRNDEGRRGNALRLRALPLRNGNLAKGHAIRPQPVLGNQPAITILRNTPWPPKNSI
jgi:hypothetical protein